MKKHIICTFAVIAALTGAVTGCSMSNNAPTSTTEPIVEQVAPSIPIFATYALTDGYALYQSSDNAFSIQYPEGSVVSGDGTDSVSLTLAGAFSTPDTISITKSTTEQQVQTVSSLLNLDALKSDNSIDITGFFTLTMDGNYKGYKYTYTSVDDPQLKGIKSIYFGTDGSAYVVNASINNGGDDANVEMINGIVDTFVNNL